MGDKQFVEIDFHSCAEVNQRDDKVVTLTWQVMDRPSGLFWFKLFNEKLKGRDLYGLRYPGFHLAHRTMEHLAQRLNDAIEIINKEGLYHIKERASGSFTQEFSNIIHHHFEVLYGDAFDPSDSFKKSSSLGQAAIGELNHCIHDMESLDRHQGDNHAFAGMIFESWNPKLFKMPTSFYEDFSLDIDFGDMAFHYAIIGKTWWEVFLDRDEEIFKEAIRPLNVVGADFDIHFGDQRIDQKTREDLFAFIRERGGDPDSPEAALGYLCVAKLVSNSLGLDLKTIKGQVALKRALAENFQVGEIRLKSGDVLINSRSLLDSYTAKYGLFGILERTFHEFHGEIEIEECPILLLKMNNKTKQPLDIRRILRGWKLPHSLSLMVAEDCEFGFKLHPGNNEYELDIGKVLSFSPGQVVSLNYNSKDKLYIIEPTKGQETL